MPESRRITERIGPWIDAAIERHGQGEEICWETTIGPGPDGAPATMVLLWFPGAVLGTVINGSIGLHAPHLLTEAEADEVIAGSLERLRAERSRQIGSPAANGHRPSGLILPG